MKYDYYEVEIPGDLADDMETLEQHAIDEAEQRTKLWCMPCEWSVKRISGDVGDWSIRFQVRRKR